jgi:protein-S-isoprenylcysteine O-methyltransferase Ste14
MFKNPSKIVGRAVGGFLASVIFLFVTLGLDRTVPSSATHYLVVLFCITGVLSLTAWGFASFVVWDDTRKPKN